MCQEQGLSKKRSCQKDNQRERERERVQERETTRKQKEREVCEFNICSGK